MSNGLACYHHPSKQAVAQCSNCGKGICKNDYDAYDGICYDCAEGLASAGVEEVMAYKARLAKTRKKMVTWGIVGAILGLVGGIGTIESNGAYMIVAGPIVMAMLGFSIGTFKAAYRALHHMFVRNKDDDTKGLFLIFFIIVAIGLIPIFFIYALIHFFKQKKLLVESDVLIEESGKAMAELRDYHKYTMAMEENISNELLKGNVYADALSRGGENAVLEKVRKTINLITINTNIARSYA
jgi:hypothetical protein